MLLQNGSLWTQYPLRRVGGTVTATDGCDVRLGGLGIKGLSALSPHTNPDWDAGASIPSGWKYGNGWLPPKSDASLWVANGGNAQAAVVVSASGAGASGINLEASSTLTFSDSVTLTATANAEGTTTITLTVPNALIAGALAAEGEATVTFTVPDAVLTALAYVIGTGDIVFTVSDATLVGLSVVQGEGSASLTFSVPSAELTLIAVAEGTTAVTFTQSANVAGGVTTTGTADFSFTVPSATMLALGHAIASALVTISSSALLRATGTLEGNITPFTELSPQNLAQEVWNALAASTNLPGTMGEKLNDAGSASNPWTEILNGGATAEEVLLAVQTAATLAQKLLRNKLVTDPADGKVKLYDDNGTLLMQADVFEDAAGTQPYRGQGAERRERLT